jgi:RNA polymerase sigma factor for flagellar operon FliA
MDKVAPAKAPQRARSATPAAADLEATWQAYAAARDPALRGRLIAAYQEFARIMAAKLYARRLYTEMEFADYLQYATIGLIESVDRFDPALGNKFETFAAARITGAVLNGIEQSSEVQQQVAARRRIVAQRVESLNEGGADGGNVFARLAELAIGLAVGFALDEGGLATGGEAPYPDNSYSGVEMKQLQARIKALVGELAPAERAVVQGHYLQQLPFEEIAVSMKLSRGRIAQIHKAALAHLRQRMLAMDEMDIRC